MTRRAAPIPPPPLPPPAPRYTPELILAYGVALSMIFAALLGGVTRTPAPTPPTTAVVSTPPVASAPPTVVVVGG